MMAGKDEEWNGQHGDLADAVRDFQHHGFERNTDPKGSGDRRERE